MTSVPKPLKFLRGHYGTLKETFETVKSGDNRRVLPLTVHQVFACSMAEGHDIPLS